MKNNKYKNDNFKFVEIQKKGNNSNMNDINTYELITDKLLTIIETKLNNNKQDFIRSKYKLKYLKYKKKYLQLKKNY